MRITTFVGASLGCSLSITAALSYHVEQHAAVAGFWQNDAMAIAWAAAGGPWGILIAAFAAFSFALVTADALAELHGIRKLLAGPAADGRRALALDNDYAVVAGQLTGHDRAIAPLTLRRLLRRELWRVYIKRLLATQMVTLALAAADLVLSQYPVLAAVPSLVTGARWQQFGAVLLLALAVLSWLALDNAVVAVAQALTRRAAAVGGPPALDAEMAAGAGSIAIVELAATIDRLAVELAARPPDPPAPPPNDGGERLAAALDAMGGTLRDTAAAQQAALERLAAGFATEVAELGRVLASRPPPELDDDKIGAAMSQLATAVDKLADPVMRRMKLLGATDRRLLAVLQRQEEVVGHFGNRWSELVTALQGMSSGLESFAQAASRLERDQRLLPPASGTSTAAGAAGLGDELQELLDDLSDYGLGKLDNPANPTTP